MNNLKKSFLFLTVLFLCFFVSSSSLKASSSEVEELMNRVQDVSIDEINKASEFLSDGRVEQVLSKTNQIRNQVRERANKSKYLDNLKTELSEISDNMKTAVEAFATYGVDDNTKTLGEGERAAVIHSYRSAFKKLPNSREELSDLIKVANGRWPSKTSETAESRAKKEFKHIYRREASMKKAHDNAAVTIMSYGLRQRAKNRNLNSERAGLKIFSDIYNRLPESTEDWNTLQAITYSGAVR